MALNKTLFVYIGMPKVVALHKVFIQSINRNNDTSTHPAAENRQQTVRHRESQLCIR